jgi:hypothetical protein
MSANSALVSVIMAPLGKKIASSTSLAEGT